LNSIEAKIEPLLEVYRAFEEITDEFFQKAVCRRGCAFCCTHVGNIDMTTLEGYMVLGRIRRMPKPRQKALNKALSKNRRLKKEHDILKCPFLNKNDTCMIYDARPFSCRRLYSLKQCDPEGPTMHRQAESLGKETIHKLQRIDDNGYSGHISFILFLFENETFVHDYLGGRFNPQSIMAYGKAHQILINRFADQDLKRR
jgi:Fe-S-cluster containining protein